ncbi:hypothetical protein [Leeuwenhoekiella sp. LLG6367-2.1]|uniref:hypothetical protein n=1 Tax=Leeuwenhoekiella sp. LLG6367-2.1 TaxID=3160833 RepID=UPI0038677940
MISIKLNPLEKRKGSITISQKFLFESGEAALKQVFSNFFPIAVESSHKYNFYDSVKYLGFSPHFEIVENGCITPEYEMKLHTENDGTVVFVSMEKL